VAAPVNRVHDRPGSRGQASSWHGGLLWIYWRIPRLAFHAGRRRKGSEDTIAPPDADPDPSNRGGGVAHGVLVTSAAQAAETKLEHGGYHAPMTVTLLITCLFGILGIALLVLARLEPGQAHICDWGWSHLLLSVGLLLGVALAPRHLVSALHRLQALAALSAIVASLALQLAGAAHYRARPWRWALAAPGFAALTALLAVLAWLNPGWAIPLATLVLTSGAWLCAWWLGRTTDTAERWVAGCFAASGLVHLTAPVMMTFGQAALTQGLATCVHLTLALGLILMSVRRTRHETGRLNGRLRQLYEQSMQGLVVLRDGVPLYANPAALRMFGFKRMEDIGDMSHFIADNEVDDTRERNVRWLQQYGGAVSWEGTRRHRDGRPLYVRGTASFIDWEGVPAMLVFMLDETERERANEALRRQALHDELTDLPNRHAALARLAELTTTASRSFALLSADLDRFQHVNESLGHEVGDALLRAVAQRLQAALPSGALLTRLGEDQFLLVQPDVADDEQAVSTARGLLAEMAAPFLLGHASLHVHMSVGIARYPAHGADGPSLLFAADVAMHRAKRQPGAVAVLYEHGMAAGVRRLLEIEQALARAIREHEFLLHYQPKYEARTRRLAGFEALVRWRPAVGQAADAASSPAEFIPAAERTGQIIGLGALVLRQAVNQLRSWGDQGLQLLPVAVNVSPLQFEEAGFAQWLLELLASHGVAPSLLEVEITETAAIANLDQVLPQLLRLRDAGIGVAFDDFGTGQSSLTLLRRLPITTLKLDRSMIEPLPEPSAGAVVRATCVLAQALGLKVVAEGVETEAQADEAAALGCSHLQGWLLSRALPGGVAGELLAVS
jgi:diguanylate cyclase (GGDEF)-like protein/PAS domain S-box-containing protein